MPYGVGHSIDGSPLLYFAIRVQPGCDDEVASHWNWDGCH